MSKKELLAELPVIAEKLRTQRELTIKMPTEVPLVGWIVSRLLARPAWTGPLLLVVADELAKIKISRLALDWRKTPRLLFLGPSPEALQGSRGREASFFILTQEDLAAPVPTPTAWQKATVNLKASDAVKKEPLLEQLVRSGYSRERSVARPGQIASRGGLLDIWPPGAKAAIRIEWHADTIEGIKTFTPGRTDAKTKKEASIIPARITGGQAKLADYLTGAKRIIIEPFPAKPDVVVSLTTDQIKALKEAARGAAKSDKKSLRDFSFLKNLKPGDWVVHADHGLAGFDGLVEQTIDGLAAEYFKLLYAEGDKLFVPVTLAEKIEKYSGAPHPTLSRLSGGAWQKAVAKVRADTLLEARSLLATAARRTLATAPVIPRSDKVEKALAASFPYEETADQKHTITAVYHDLAQTKPMDRLVCGDVGFGKTEVAIRAAAKAALAGYQTAVLSPTTILTQQHIDTFTDRLKDLPVIIGSLSRFASAPAQKETLSSLAAGKIDIVVGTHRLLSHDVKFKNLGLIIIDEEQRFGVAHKETLKNLRQLAHVLTLTATPIPRTLHLGLSGVRDISTMATAPTGRLPIATHIEPHNQTKIKAVLEREAKRGGQAYYLYNHVETIALKKQELAALLPQLKFGVLHGQLPEQEVAAVMHQFDGGRLDVLVCSTIIENGLDLPNVNTLIVDNAVQFGLAQLHQIRGRIGRGDRQAYAYFFYKRQKLSGEAEKRLLALEEARELGAGFDLARRDMEIRGVGNVLGKAQHGHVASVGLGMYLRLLREAVEEIESGEPVAMLPDIAVDLPIEARIPQFFEPNKEKRIELYHQWALVNDLEELKTSQDEVAKDGALPKALANLFYILRLKLLGRQAGLKAIDTANSFASASEQSIVLIPREPIAPGKFAQMLDIAPLWHYATDELKINREDLGSDWMKKLEESIRALAT